jgi:hypothetical protein
MTKLLEVYTTVVKQRIFLKRVKKTLENLQILTLKSACGSGCMYQGFILLFQQVPDSLPLVINNVVVVYPLILHQLKIETGKHTIT